jgi:hypothetical protein
MSVSGEGCTSSEPTAFLSHARFVEEGIPVVGHTHPLHARDVNGYAERTWRIEWTEGSRVISARSQWIRQISPQNSTIEWLHYRASGGREIQTVVYPGSLLDELRGIGQELARCYSWEQIEAMWFVLTGIIPLVCPINWRFEAALREEYDSTYIVLSCAPWVSAKTVQRLYRQAQQEVLGKENRPLSERSLEPFRFAVLEHALEGDWPGWRRLRDRWNQKHAEFPEWQFEDVRYFRNTVARVMETLVHPPHALMPLQRLSIAKDNNPD